MDKGIPLRDAQCLRAHHLATTAAHSAADVPSLFRARDVGANGKHMRSQGDGPQTETNKTTLPGDERNCQKQSGDYPKHLVLDPSSLKLSMIKNESLPLSRTAVLSWVAAIAADWECLITRRTN